MIQQLNRMTWSEIDSLDRSHLAYVLPVGSNEQHGRHLPVGTDDLILDLTLDTLVQSMNVKNTFLCLPPIYYGNSFEHLNFTGTMTIKTTTMIAIVEDLLACMQRHGVHYLVILNSHGGNTSIFRAQAQEWKQRFGIKIYNINYFGSSFYNDAQPLIDTKVHLDVHGGELETSYLEYALPEVVRMEELAPEKDVLVDLTDYDPCWLSSDLAPDNGLLGAASRSTPEKGHLLNDYIQDKLQMYFHKIDEEIG